MFVHNSGRNVGPFILNWVLSHFVKQQVNIVRQTKSILYRPFLGGFLLLGPKGFSLLRSSSFDS